MILRYSLSHRLLLSRAKYVTSILFFYEYLNSLPSKLLEGHLSPMCDFDWRKPNCSW